MYGCLPPLRPSMADSGYVVDFSGDLGAVSFVPANYFAELPPPPVLRPPLPASISLPPPPPASISLPPPPPPSSMAKRAREVGLGEDEARGWSSAIPQRNLFLRRRRRRTPVSSSSCSWHGATYLDFCCREEAAVEKNDHKDGSGLEEAAVEKDGSNLKDRSGGGGFRAAEAWAMYCLGGL